MPDALPALLLQAIHQAFNAVLITDAVENGHRIVYVNPALCEMTGYAAHELLGRNPRMLQGPQTCAKVIAELRSCVAEGRFFKGSTFNYRKDGSPYLLEWNISPVRDGNGRITHFVSVQHDLSAIAQAQASSDIFARTLDATEDGVLICNHLGIIEFANRGYEKITGLRARELVGRKPSVAQSGRHDQAFYAALWSRLTDGQPVREIFVNRRTDGTEVHCEESITPLRNRQGEVTHYVSMVRDITARVLSERAFREQMQHDSLTGALTRTSGSLHLENAVAQSRALGATLALALVDIDYFKQVNDRFGHPTGDKVLATVAGALAGCLRASDKIIRWGGEEFLLIMAGCDEASAVSTLDRCRHAVHQACADMLPMPITISAGVGQIEPGQELADCIERIDQLLYRAKQEGRNQVRAVHASDG
ncbi:PAS domain S-box protein [Pantoea sp. 18069]|uniref:sensor domain-containing diguanylate cyclase n=1 Tax=Pantoea sp. 18069 TaxID=2681415 RepID=UPI00190F7FF9|nr:PAS domain S-box protein [Pantoea sp. 18069]